MVRPLLTLVFATLTALALAQAPRMFLVRSASPIDAWAEKMISHVVMDLEPHAMVSFDTPLVKIRTSEHVSSQAVILALNHAGIGTFVLVVDPATRSAGDPSTSFPTIGNSGDPVQDELDYHVAKRAWVTAHPEEYRTMLGVGGRPSNAEPIPSRE